MYHIQPRPQIKNKAFLSGARAGSCGVELVLHTRSSVNRVWSSEGLKSEKLRITRNSLFHVVINGGSGARYNCVKNFARMSACHYPFRSLEGSLEIAHAILADT